MFHHFTPGGTLNAWGLTTEQNIHSSSSILKEIGGIVGHEGNRRKSIEGTKDLLDRIKRRGWRVGYSFSGFSSKFCIFLNQPCPANKPN